ncbi:MAG TPA: hypothetical protein VHW91_08095, partial [Candidatus Dormibacteraeota bacterium]|nr:hypothetical protein [Candidatus Dormibacteraeota bacterium]
MRGDLLLISDGLEGAVPWVSQVLRASGLNLKVVSAGGLVDQRPADAIFLRLREQSAVDTCWRLHRQGHGSVVALSASASSSECIRLLNAGADYYLDTWMPAAELVARMRVVLRFTGWLDRRSMA